MTGAQIEIQLIAAAVAVACALPGVFLVLRRTAMLSDAISHTVLLGIVLAFFVTGDLASPLLVFGAAAMGVATVALVSLLQQTRRVHADAAIGLVFPALFSLAVILISRFADQVHLDSDIVLLGELVFAPFDRMIVRGLDIGPRALWVMLGILVLNALAITVFYKELKLTTFDAGLAATLGFAPALVNLGLMSLVSLTAVGAFDAVGSILVVALMIAPPAAAYLLTDRVPRMIGWSAAIGVAAAISGYWLARWLDASIAGSMATMCGVAFLTAFIVAPERGLLATARRRERQRWQFAEATLAIHLLNHEGLPTQAEESSEQHLSEHVRWNRRFAERVTVLAQRHGTLTRRDGQLFLTEKGRQLAQQTLIR